MSEEIEEATDELAKELVEEEEEDGADEIEELREQITNIHDTIDNIKSVSQNVSQQLIDKAENTENEELKSQYVQLAERAGLAYRRVEFGDNTIVRGGL